MLEALEGAKHRQQTARARHVPIPINGWSTRDKYTASFTREALRYCSYTRNWMWLDGRLTIRPGFTTHGTGMTDDVDTIMEYAAIGGTLTLFAATNGGANACTIWDVTTPGAGVSSATGLDSARWQHTMFATTSAVYLVCANGADPVRHYNGSVWAEPSITGVTSSDLIHVTAHKGRLWFTEENTLSSWYLAPFAVAGAATKFNLAPFCSKGGYLMAIGSWSYDGGSGPDDYIAFITSMGQLVIYAGLDPNSVDEWSLVGIFNVDKPIGRRCFMKFGADMVLFTESGPLQISQVLAKVAPRDELADPIRDEFISAVGVARSQFGWEIMPYTKRGWIFANIPLAVAGTYEQFVFNPFMSAWFRFTEMDARCWCQSGNSMYFGGAGGVVYVWDNGQVDDDGSEVTADVQFTMWNYGTATHKIFTLMRPHFFTDGTVSPIVAMNTEFNEDAPTSQAEATEAPVGAVWDDEFWDEASWGGGMVPVREWLTAEGEGSVAAPRIICSTLSAQLSLTAVDVVYIDGGIL